MSVTIYCTYLDSSQNNSVLENFTYYRDLANNKVVVKVVGDKPAWVFSNERDTTRHPRGTDSAMFISWQQGNKRISFYSPCCPVASWREFTFYSVSDFKEETLTPASPSSPPVCIICTYPDGSQNINEVENFSFALDPSSMYLTVKGNGRWLPASAPAHPVAGFLRYEFIHNGKRHTFSSRMTPSGLEKWTSWTYSIQDYKVEPLSLKPVSPVPALAFILQAPQARLTRLSPFGQWQSEASNIKLEIAGPKVTLSGNGSFLRLPNGASQTQTDVWKTKDPQADTLLTLEVEEQKHALLLKHVKFSGPFEGHPAAGFLYQAELVEHQESALPTPAPSAPSPVPTSLVKSESEKIILYRLYASGWGNRAEVTDLHCTIAPGRKHFLLQCQYSSLEAPPREQLASYMPVSWPGKGQMLFWIQDGKVHRLFTTREARFAIPAGDRLEFEGDILQYDILDLTTKSESEKTILCQGSCLQTVMQRRYEGGTVHETDVKDVSWKIWQEGSKTLFEIQSIGGWYFSQGLRDRQLDYTPEEKAQFAPGRFQRCFRWIENDVEHQIFCDNYGDHQSFAYGRMTFSGEVASHFHEPVKKPEPEKVISAEEPTVTIARDTLPVLSWDIQPLTSSSLLDESWVTTPSNPIEVELATGALSPNEVRELLGRDKYSPAEASPEPVSLETRKLITTIQVPDELLGIPSEPEQDPLHEVCNEQSGCNWLIDVADGALGATLIALLSLIGVTMFEYFEKLSGKDMQTLIRGAILGVASSLISLAVIKLMKWAVTKKPPMPESPELQKLRELFLGDKTVLADSQSFVKIIGSDDHRYDLNSDGTVDTFSEPAGKGGKPIRLQLSTTENKQRIELFQEAKAACLARQQAITQKYQQDLLNNLRTLKV